MSGTIESMPVPRAVGHLGGGGALLLASAHTTSAIPTYLWMVVAIITAVSVLITISRLIPRFW